MAMNCNSIEDLINLISRRDQISYNEACYIVEDCRREVNRTVVNGGSYEEVADIIADYLSLEPDFIEIILDF